MAQYTAVPGDMPLMKKIADGREQCREFGYYSAVRTLSTGPISAKAGWCSRRSLPSYELALHAEPVAPLNDRDIRALESVFNYGKLEDAIADVRVRLQRLYPEPCWEDDPYSFLGDYYRRSTGV